MGEVGGEVGGVEGNLNNADLHTKGTAKSSGRKSISTDRQFHAQTRTP